MRKVTLLPINNHEECTDVFVSGERRSENGEYRRRCRSTIDL